MAQRGRRDRIRSTNDDDKLQAKPKHLRNAMFTLLLLFGGLVSFVFIMAPPDDPSAGINPQLEELVTKLIQIEKSSLRGPVSDKLESPVESSTHQTSVEAPQVQPVQTGLTLSRTESGSDAGCLEDVPVDTGKHIVTPPEGPVTLVCCQSTKGPLSIAVHKSWAPIGAQRFLDMVTSGFFSTKVGLFRALKGFLIQFGLPGDPKVLETWNKRGHLQDDPSWLPLGPTNREINGVKRYQKGM
jgi:Cyclophilin type peptidyl-prolyl cis-trans isomerase/CLD